MGIDRYSRSMSIPSVELETERLMLRQARAEDVAAIQSYRSLPEVSKFQFWTTFDAVEASQLVDEQAGLTVNTPGSWYQLVIIAKTSRSVIGDLALHFREDDHRQVEVGINLVPTEQGKGLAAEALRRVLNYLFEDLDKHRVIAITDAANESAAALFRRAGFRQEGHFLDHILFKGSYGSEYLFALLAREWTVSSFRMSGN